MSVELTIERGSPVPLYYQLSQQLEEAIRVGTLKPGDRIDTETTIAERYGLSRPTVRQAIQELVNKGMLVRRRGVGTQVVQTPLGRPVALTSLYDDLVLAGHEPRTDVLSLTNAPADVRVAEALRIAEGTEVIAIERLRFDRGEPLAIMRNWLPAGLAPITIQALESSGLYEALRRAGVHIRVAHQRIGARLATGTEARLLQVPGPSALVTMERTTFDIDGAPIEFASHDYRADAYTFETTLLER